MKKQYHWIESKSFAYAVSSLCFAITFAAVYIGNRVEHLAKAIAEKN